MADYRGGDDYDYDAYIKKYGALPDRSKGQHLTDEFKKPNHITFSNESVYHSNATPGGKWEEREGTWHYTPSGYVVAQHGEEKLRKYFDEHEKDAVLHLPPFKREDRGMIGGGPKE